MYVLGHRRRATVLARTSDVTYAEAFMLQNAGYFYAHKLTGELFCVHYAQAYYPSIHMLRKVLCSNSVLYQHLTSDHSPLMLEDNRNIRKLQASTRTHMCQVSQLSSRLPETPALRMEVVQLQLSDSSRSPTEWSAKIASTSNNSFPLSPFLDQIKSARCMLLINNFRAYTDSQIGHAVSMLRMTHSQSDPSYNTASYTPPTKQFLGHLYLAD
ncbi:hypothetical protein QAD02_017423 [Eretmocerus hayati]|uniref:Uncharacterized protein n=1 Tax=Eretmocerus hayati TaxID=131215 RepID=A0ACC2PF43_9HYME|nr:hypothetical protein QAD02_017423 [Eretmocerus hayati]